MWVYATCSVSQGASITVIVWFYLFIFPLRGLVIALSGYTGVLNVRGTVTESELISILLLASAATTVLVESYYLANPYPSRRPPIATEPAARYTAVVKLAGLLTALSLVGLAGVLAQSGGISGARSQYFQHTVTQALEGNTSLADSAWQLFAVPAVWCCAYVVFNKGATGLVRFVFAASSIIIIVAALLIYGGPA